MADKDQNRNDEEIIKHTETEVTELDDQALDEASGGSMDMEEEALSSSNNNCVC